MILKLKDGTEIAVLDSTLSNLICVECASISEVEEIRKKLTKENLSEFQYMEDSGKLYGEYEHYILEDVSYVELEDGILFAKYHIRQLSDVELRLDALETGQETQDGAIEELASIIGGE